MKRNSLIVIPGRHFVTMTILLILCVAFIIAYSCQRKDPPKSDINSLHSKSLKKSNPNNSSEMYGLECTEPLPVFPGGDVALLSYLSKQIKYPASAQNMGIQGKVVVKFQVMASGYIGKVEILRSLHPDCDKEAIRVIKRMPRWTPGKVQGKVETVWFTLPITYKLE